MSDLRQIRKSHWDRTVEDLRALIPYDTNLFLLRENLTKLLKSPCRFEQFFNTLVPNPVATVVVYRDRGWLVQFFWEVELPLSKRFRDYHYQNQSDRPSHVSREEWRERKLCWERVFRGFSHPCPSEAGLTYPLLEESDTASLALRVGRK